MVIDMTGPQGLQGLRHGPRDLWVQPVRKGCPVQLPRLVRRGHLVNPAQRDLKGHLVSKARRVKLVPAAPL